jgi:hypothetical protein
VHLPKIHDALGSIHYIIAKRDRKRKEDRERDRERVNMR